MSRQHLLVHFSGDAMTALRWAERKGTAEDGRSRGSGSSRHRLILAF